MGYKPSARTVYKYMNVGARNKYTGKLVILESVRIGIYVYTSEAACQRFVEALNKG